MHGEAVYSKSSRKLLLYEERIYLDATSLLDGTSDLRFESN